jgi:hypothetical protein
VDGFAGIGGLHLLSLARAGTRVTVAANDARALDAAASAYRRAGLEDRLTLFQGDGLPDQRFDLVLDFNGLPNVRDWQSHLAMLCRHGRELALFVTHPASYGALASRLLARLGPESDAPRQFENETTRRRVLEPELRRHGRVVDRAWVDCPWWPDLFVETGTTLAQDLRSRFGLRRSGGAPRFVYEAPDFPYGQGAPPELERTLRRHPVFDGSALAPLFAHHRAYRVRLAP